MKVLIIGAGLAGLSTAYHLKKSIDFEIFEKNQYVGGYSSSYQVEEYTFDYSGHYLHFRNKDIRSLVKKLLQDNIREVKRLSAIFSYNTLTNYPYQSNFDGLPDEIIIQNLLGIIKAKYEKKKKNTNNFYEWILKSFGEGVAKNFMVPYNTKLWGVHPREMGLNWIDRFIPNIDLEKVIKGALNKRNDNLGYNSYFFYPIKGGIGVLPEAFAESLKSKISLNSMVEKVLTENNSIKIKEAKEKRYYDFLVNTSPLKGFISNIINKPPIKIKDLAKKLISNKILVSNIGLNEDKINYSWIYFPEHKYHFFRIGNYSKSSKNMSPKGGSSIYIETNVNNFAGKNYDDIIKKNLDDLINIGFITSRRNIDIISNEILENAYPIPIINIEKYMKNIKSYLKKNNIFTIGRYGNWEYSSMEDAILRGKKVAEEINSKIH